MDKERLKISDMRFATKRLLETAFLCLLLIRLFK